MAGRKDSGDFYTKKIVRLKMQTPRILDDIATKVKDVRKKNPEFQGDPAFLFTL